MDELGMILAIDKNDAKVKDDAFSIDFDENGNYILHVYIADFLSSQYIEAFELIEKRLHSDPLNQSSSIKRQFSDFSLSEREEKPVFDFKFVISKDAEVLSFEASKKRITVDIEMTHDDVADTIDEDSYLVDYIALAYELGEKIAKRNSLEVNFDDDFEKIDFPFPFPKEFLKLLNITLLNQCMANNLPLIYFVYEKNEMYYSKYKPCYYTFQVDGESNVYARFNAPIRSMDSLFNLMVYNDIVFNKRFNNIDSIAKYKDCVDGYQNLVTAFNDNKRTGGRR